MQRKPMAERPNWGASLWSSERRAMIAAGNWAIKQWLL